MKRQESPTTQGTFRYTPNGSWIRVSNERPVKYGRSYVSNIIRYFVCDIPYHKHYDSIGARRRLICLYIDCFTHC